MRMVVSGGQDQEGEWRKTGSLDELFERASDRLKDFGGVGQLIIWIFDRSEGENKIMASAWRKRWKGPVAETD